LESIGDEALGLDSIDEDSGIVILEDDQATSVAAPVSESNPSMPKEGMKVYIVVRLDRLSLHLDRKEGDGIEAHLVAASASFNQMLDGAVQSRVCMGWFWVLDMLDSSTPRRQRLLAHSTLPRSADELSLCGGIRHLQGYRAIRTINPRRCRFWLSGHYLL
jgi:hypothetical protein